MKMFIVLFLLLCSVMFLQFDDSPNNEVTSYVSLIENRMAIESEAYLYLNGIAVSEGQDVISEGRRLFSEYNSPPQVLALFDGGNSTKEDSTSDLTPGSDSFFNCKFLDEACFSAISANSDSWGYEMNRWSEYLKRYENFISYSEFTTMTRPSIEEKIQDYTYLVFGNRLKMLSILSLVSFDRHQEAFGKLTGDNARLRKHIELADNLIHKMVFVSLLANNLDLLVYLNSIKAVYDFQEIPLLSMSEINMTLPLVREFVIGHDALLELDGSPEIFEIGGNMPYWLVKAIFKPYMTMNDSVNDYSESIKLSQLRPKEFASAIEAIELNEERGRSFRNYIGSVLNEISIPSYYKYTARMHDLNCKITLVNQALGEKKGGLNNPYGTIYGQNKEKDNLICLAGPLEDGGNFRCVRKYKSPIT